MVRASQRGDSESYGTALRYDAVDLLFTAGTVGIGTMPEIARAGLSPEDLKFVDKDPIGEYAVRIPIMIPDFVHLLGGFSPTRDENFYP